MYERRIAAAVCSRSLRSFSVLGSHGPCEYRMWQQRAVVAGVVGVTIDTDSVNQLHHRWLLPDMSRHCIEVTRGL